MAAERTGGSILLLQAHHPSPEVVIPLQGGRVDLSVGNPRACSRVVSGLLFPDNLGAQFRDIAQALQAGVGNSSQQELLV